MQIFALCRKKEKGQDSKSRSLLYREVHYRKLATLLSPPTHSTTVMPVFSAYNTNSFSVLSVNTAATHHNLNSLSKVWKKFFDNEDTRPLLQNTPDITVLEIHSPKASLFRPKNPRDLFSLKSKLYADCAPRQIFMPGLFFLVQPTAFLSV